MSKHTPGPWKFYTKPQPNGCPIVGNNRGLMVAMLAHSINHEDQREEAEANARLIAAAPDLLEACINAREWLDGWASADPYIGILEAAIAKATGADNAEVVISGFPSSAHGKGHAVTPSQAFEFKADDDA